MNEEQKLKEFFEYVRVMGDMYEETACPKGFTVRKTLDEITFVFLENKERIKFARRVLLDSLIDALFSVHIFHKWEKIYIPEYKAFLGKTIVVRKQKFRRCKKCGKVQELSDRRNLKGGRFWITLLEEQVAELNDQLAKGKLFLTER